MTPQKLTEMQIRKIKELVDEMVVTGGIVKVEDEELILDGMNIEEIIHSAYKYYTMIYTGKNIYRSEGTKEWYRCLYCPEKCEDYIMLQNKTSITTQEERIPGACPRGEHFMPKLQCSRCGKEYLENPFPEQQYITLCFPCRREVEDDLKVIERLIS